MVKLPRGRFPKPERARRTLLAALKDLRARKSKIIAGMRMEKRPTKDGKHEVLVRTTTKRVGNRLNDLERAVMTVQDAIDSKRYNLGFKGLARLQRKERERVRWHQRQKPKQLSKERLLAKQLDRKVASW